MPLDALAWAFPYREFMRASLPVGAALTAALLLLSVARELLSAYAQEPRVAGTRRAERARAAARSAGRYVPPLLIAFGIIVALEVLAILNTG